MLTIEYRLTEQEIHELNESLLKHFLEKLATTMANKKIGDGTATDIPRLTPKEFEKLVVSMKEIYLMMDGHEKKPSSTIVAVPININFD